MRRTPLLLLAVLLALVGCTGLGGEPEIIATVRPAATAAPVSVPAQIPPLAMGAAVYAENCTRCHGIGGAGDGQFVLSGEITQIVDFTDPATMAGDDLSSYFTIITQGRLSTLMPPWGESLSEAERWAVALYTYALPVLTDVADEPDLDAAAIQARLASFSSVLTDTQRADVAEYAIALRGGSVEVAAGVPADVPAGDAVAPAATAEIGAVADASLGAAAAAPTEVITVRGTITAGTPGMTIPADLPLTLYVLDQFHRNLVNGTSDTEGAFTFNDVAYDAAKQYAVTADYNGVTFVSEISAPPPDANSELVLPVTIYETGADASAIVIDRMLSQVDVVNGELSILQLIHFTNTSDRVYLTSTDDGQPTGVRVGVPPGAIYRDFMDAGYRISADGQSVVDTQAVVPGAGHTMHLTFSLPYSEAMSNNVAQIFDYPIIGPVEVTIGTPGLTLTGDQIVPAVPSVEGVPAEGFYAAEITLDAGNALQYAITGTPVVAAATVPAASSGGSTNTLAIVLMVAGVGALGAAGVLYVRERRQPAPTAPSAVPAVSAGPDSQDLMRQIADLDMQRKQGKISAAAYDRQRSALKAQLKAVIRQQGEKNS